MFCTKCGTQIPDGQNQCPNCQAPAYQKPYVAQQPVQPQMQQPVQPQMQQPMQAPAQNMKQPYAQLNNPMAPQKPKKPKKKSEGVNLLLVGGVALVAVVALLVIIFGGVFSSPQDKLLKMEKTGANLAAKAIAGAYGDYVEELKDSIKKMENGTGAEMQVKLTADETLLESLAMAVLYEYMYGYDDMSGLDLNWLTNIVLNVDMDVKEDAMGMQVGVGVNDTVLTSLVAQLNLENNKMYFAVPDLNAQYLYADLNAMGVDMSMASFGLKEMKELVAALPSEKDVQKMLETYLLILADYADEVKEDKQTVTVADKSKDMKVLAAKIGEKKLMQMMVDICTVAVEDQTLKALIDAFAGYANALEAKTYEQYGITYTPTDVYGEMKEELQYAIEELKESVEQAEETNFLVLSNYVVSGTIVGRKAQVYSEGAPESASAYYMFVPTSDGGVFEVVIPEDSILGSLVSYYDCKLSGQISGKNMDVDLIVEGEKMLTLRTQNLTVKDGAINGKVRLVPGAALWDEMSATIPENIKDMYLQMNCEGTKTDGKTEVKLVIAEKTMVSVEVSGKETKYDSFNVPADALNVEDPTSEVWVTGLKLDSLIKNMQTAKIPNEYVQIVQQLEMMLALQ